MTSLNNILTRHGFKPLRSKSSQKSTPERRLTEAECKTARCGQIDGDGDVHPRHSGGDRLSRDVGGKRAECIGCGRFYTPSQVRELKAARKSQAARWASRHRVVEKSVLSGYPASRTAQRPGRPGSIPVLSPANQRVLESYRAGAETDLNMQGDFVSLDTWRKIMKTGLDHPWLHGTYNEFDVEHVYETLKRYGGHLISVKPAREYSVAMYVRCSHPSVLTEITRMKRELKADECSQVKSDVVRIWWD